MKKTFILAAALIAFAACNKKDTTAAEAETTANAQTETAALETDNEGASETETTEATTATTDAPKEAEVKDIKVEEPQAVKVEYASFGDKILADKALSKEQMLQKYKNLKAGDTVAVKFKSKIKEVCSKKGCWMSLELPGGQESFVKFKDYAFFVPLNAAEQDAIVSGKAFVSETSVAQLQHYAKDAGESDEAIAKITKPRVEYKFMADGVLISK